MPGFYNQPIQNPFSSMQSFQQPTTQGFGYQMNYYPQQNQMMGQNMQMPQSTNNPGSFSGRIVNKPDDIVPAEVPNDGHVGVFPVIDGSCIYVKAWTNDGRIHTDRYILEQKTQQTEGTTGPSEFSQVMSRLDKIEEMLNLINPDLKKLYADNAAASASSE